MERMEMPGRTVTIPFLVMELADAGSVDGYLRRYGPLSPEMATWFILQAVRGLKATRTIHRDIKPGNLLIFHGKTSKKPEKPHFTPGTLEGSRIVITDFGLAKETDGASGLTKSAMAFGTPDYMSPEQCRDAKRVSIEGDIYSLGIMFYELMLGHTPFRSEDDSPMSIMKRQVEEIPEIPDTVPTAQSNIIARCLEKAPEDRYRTLSSLEEALRSIYQWPKSMDAVPEPTRQAESETSTWLSKATSWFTKKPT
jgi:serine/threonine-protein kinase